MKKLFLALALLAAFASAAWADPSIYVAMPIYNYGTVLDGYAVTHTFVLENAGDETLEITGVRTSCGCTTTALSTNAIAPGESVELEVVFHTSGYGGRTASKTVNVYSNDPAMPILVLQITGQVAASEPHLIAVGDANYSAYLLIDVRAADAYEAHHLLGAVNVLPADLLTFVATLPNDTFIIVYDTAFDAVEASVKVLRDAGFYYSFAVVGGLDTWVRAYGTRNLTNPDIPYSLSAEVSLGNDESPVYYMPIGDLDYVYTLFVDVRDPVAYAAGHILSAINIPADDIATWLELLPDDAPIVVYGQDGSESEDVALWLINHGIEKAQSMLGGLDEWIRLYGDWYLLPEAS